MSEQDRHVLLGRIKAAHGVRGDVVIESYTDEPADIAAYGPLATEGGVRRLEVAVVRVTPKGVIARIAGISDRTSAEALKGQALYVERAHLPTPSEGEFYRADFAGLSAEDPQGHAVGTVVALVNYGAGDLLELRLAGKRDTLLIPFTDAFVPVVDIRGGRLVVDLPTESPDDD